MRFIGDVHGKFNRYKKLVKEVPVSIQVGDMGVGFRYDGGVFEGEFYDNPPHYAMVQGNHRFIRGNHDNPGVCRNHSQWIPDGTVEGDMMFIGGAVSIDRALRREGYSWWADEELSIEELNVLVDKYIEVRPRIMVTHECPEQVAGLLSVHNHQKMYPEWSSRTRQALQAMWSAHSPELWIFGHWHNHFDQVLNGTRFICLAELETIDLDLNQ